MLPHVVGSLFVFPYVAHQATESSYDNASCPDQTMGGPPQNDPGRENVRYLDTNKQYPVPDVHLNQSSQGPGYPSAGDGYSSSTGSSNPWEEGIATVTDYQCPPKAILANSRDVKVFGLRERGCKGWVTKDKFCVCFCLVCIFFRVRLKFTVKVMARFITRTQEYKDLPIDDDDDHSYLSYPLAQPLTTHNESESGSGTSGDKQMSKGGRGRRMRRKEEEGEPERVLELLTAHGRNSQRGRDRSFLRLSRGLVLICVFVFRGVYEDEVGEDQNPTPIQLKIKTAFVNVFVLLCTRSMRASNIRRRRCVSSLCPGSVLNKLDKLEIQLILFLIFIPHIPHCVNLLHQIHHGASRARGKRERGLGRGSTKFKSVNALLRVVKMGLSLSSVTGVGGIPGVPGVPGIDVPKGGQAQDGQGQGQGCETVIRHHPAPSSALTWMPPPPKPLPSPKPQPSSTTTIACTSSSGVRGVFSIDEDPHELFVLKHAFSSRPFPLRTLEL
ncbi:hypothetical protein C8R42DRAFT_637170 [Lentinula raphanica]|nr:hypothetical protein C8R42DRAFT_637170 [Lentinula raphanica]